MMRGSSSENRGGVVASLLTRCDTGCRHLSRLMLIVSGWAVLAMGLMVATDVAWRALSGHNFGGVDEIASYLLAICISWSLAAAFHARAHIRVDVFYRKFPLPVRAVLDVVATFSLLCVGIYLLYSSWTVLETSWSRSSNSASALQVPMVMPQAIWALGAVVFMVSLLVAWLQMILDVLGGRMLAVVGKHGVLTAEEEAMDALTQSRGG